MSDTTYPKLGPTSIARELTVDFFTDNEFQMYADRNGECIDGWYVKSVNYDIDVDGGLLRGTVIFGHANEQP